MNIITHRVNILSCAARDLFADLELVTECGGRVTLHKVIAAAVSPRFKSSLVSKQVNSLPIRNAKLNAVENVINFIYTGKATFTNTGDKQDFVDAFNIMRIDLGQKVNETVRKLNPYDTDADIENSSQEQQKQEFKCSNCNKSFESRPRLLRHTREVHRPAHLQNKPKPMYECEKCSKVYTVY